MKKIVAIGFIGALVTLGCTIRFSSSSRPQATTPATSACSHEYTPVCGKDGVTYSNSCEAERARVSIAAVGTCPSPSSLTADERSFLFWLLRARMDLGLPSVSVRHMRTEKGTCDSCVVYYYGWGNPEVSARVEVRDGAVVSAVDTTGYDYIAAKQGTSGPLN